MKNKMNLVDNSINLGKYLQIIGQEVRFKIMKTLYDSEGLISFANLKRVISKDKGDTANISYHLNILKENNYISSSDDGYSLTKLGKKILEKLLDIGDIIDDESKTIKIRTSNYTFEPFDINKITEYLIREANIPENLAKSIADEVKIQLSHSKVEYLTAPLIREYINGILIEKGYEEYRHKLTRLGLPPFEINSLLKSQQFSCPSALIKKLGNETSEQYLLLNLLPRDLADLYLSGQIMLLHLNSWAFRPLSLTLSTNHLFRNIEENLEKIESNITVHQIKEIFYDFFSILNELKKFFSEDILLFRFNQIIPLIFLRFKRSTVENLIYLLLKNLNSLNSSFARGKSQISLDFCHNNSIKGDFDWWELIEHENDLIKMFKNIEFSQCTHYNPLVLYDCINLNSQNIENSVFGRYIEDLNKLNMLFYRNRDSSPLNNQLISIKSDYREVPNIVNRIILDKILINLPKIAIEANQNDNLFLELLESTIDSLLPYFKIKQNLVEKNLKSFKNWENLEQKLLFPGKKPWSEEPLKAMSYFGLNEAVLFHCGIELDRIEQSRLFSKQILSTIASRINEINREEHRNLVLSQPHVGNYLANRWLREPDNFFRNYESFSTEFIRVKSKLYFNKKLSIFKDFQEIVDGGALLNLFTPDPIVKEEIIESIKNLINAEIRYFCFSSKNVNYYDKISEKKGTLIRPDSLYIDSNFISDKISQRFL